MLDTKKVKHLMSNAMSGYVKHDGGVDQPEGSRGLAAVDIKVQGTELKEINPAFINWDKVEEWRPAAVQLKDVLPDFSKPSPAVSLSELGGMSVQTTLNERGKTHGKFDEQARTAQVLKFAIRDAVAQGHDSYAHCLTSYQREALDTICMKISRILHGNPNEPDHWRDIAGYATLVENILVHGKSHLG